MKNKKLKNLIKSKGISFVHLANVLNISAVSFNLKINGKNEFKQNEIEILVEELNIDTKDIHLYFFNLYRD